MLRLHVVNLQLIELALSLKLVYLSIKNCIKLFIYFFFTWQRYFVVQSPTTMRVFPRSRIANVHGKMFPLILQILIFGEIASVNCEPRLKKYSQA